MLRSFPRAAPSSSSIRGTSLRTALRNTKSPLPICTADARHQQIRSATVHAISNPTLAGIEKRWEGMPPQEQADLWMALRDRMKNDWHDLTLQERKAAYWIAFGPHGPRALPPPGENWMVAGYTAIGIGVSFILFLLVRTMARPPPGTMNAQYQEMTNEYLKNQKTEPITGVSSEGYKGKGMVQSKPRKGGIPKDDDE
ncbi:Cytochrome c oxidase subunit 5A [Mycoblastus sanguinarius]|nr:Cytochrome c oxidase subunit 5A [Mycoblastus sanguinarius]